MVNYVINVSNKMFFLKSFMYNKHVDKKSLN